MKSADKARLIHLVQISDLTSHFGRVQQNTRLSTDKILRTPRTRYNQLLGAWLTGAILIGLSEFILRSGVAAYYEAISAKYTLTFSDG